MKSWKTPTDEMVGKVQAGVRKENGPPVFLFSPEESLVAQDSS